MLVMSPKESACGGSGITPLLSLTVPYRQANSPAALTHIKHNCDLNNLTSAFIRSNDSITEKFDERKPWPSSIGIAKKGQWTFSEDVSDSRNDSTLHIDVETHATPIYLYKMSTGLVNTLAVFKNQVSCSAKRN